MSSIYVIFKVTTWPPRITIIQSSKHDRFIYRCTFHLPIACVNEVYIGIGLDSTLFTHQVGSLVVK